MPVAASTLRVPIVLDPPLPPEPYSISTPSSSTAQPERFTDSGSRQSSAISDVRQCSGFRNPNEVILMRLQIDRASQRSVVVVVAAALLTTAQAGAATTSAGTSADEERWFQTTEQALMDAIALGDKTPWERVLDPTCVVTTEEG